MQRRTPPPPRTARTGKTRVLIIVVMALRPENPTERDQNGTGKRLCRKLAAVTVGIGLMGILTGCGGPSLSGHTYYSVSAIDGDESSISFDGDTWKMTEDDKLVLGHMDAGRQRQHHLGRIPWRDHHPNPHRRQRRIPVCGQGEVGHPLLPEQGGGADRHTGVHGQPAEHRHGLSGIRRLEEDDRQRKLLPAGGDDLLQGRHGRFRQGRLRSGELHLPPRAERRRMGEPRTIPANTPSPWTNSPVSIPATTPSSSATSPSKARRPPTSWKSCLTA